MSASHFARIFRLFVSSTFSDFIAEREALSKEVFPELEEYCAKRGARFQAVDLRWGITEEAQREHDTMRICLEEVRRCQKQSPRPNFAVLLGDRYGWEPVPARIPQDHWLRLMKAANSTDRGLIKQSYRLDSNAIPAVYCLRERADDQAVADLSEALLLQALRRAARGFRGSARLPYFASATHQEIALGALSRRGDHGQVLDPEQHVHVYARHLQGLPNDASAKDFIDWDANTGQAVSGARQRLLGLETQLRRQLGEHVHDLHTTWSRHGRDGVVNKAYLKRFCDAFLSHQKALIDAELASFEQTDERQQREQAHRDFGADRARVFAGRGTLLARIARYTASGPNRKDKRSTKSKRPTVPLILLGGGGSGKSALLARAAQETVRVAKRSGAVVLQRYIGGVPGTESLMTTLTALTADIASLYGQPEPPVAENAKELAESFRVALGHASAKRPLTIYLDALDQLDSADGAWQLDWLPKELPEHVRVVASARTGTTVEQSARMIPDPNPDDWAISTLAWPVIEVPVLKPIEGRAMLKAWMADKQAAWFNAGIAPSTGRRLTAQQEQAVLAASNGSALWLKLAYEEAATWTSWIPPRELPSTVQGLIEDLIDHRLNQQEKHPTVFTERALAYLTAGRFGLSETELGRALGTDKSVRAEFQTNEKTKRKWDDYKQLPPILWSRLYFDLQAYLGLAQVDGALLMRWFHREFAEVLKARYLGSAESRQLIHGNLADSLFSLERELRPSEDNDDALFKATDAGGKQVSAALRRVMEQPWQLSRAGRLEDLRALVTDFGFCMGKCAANAGADFIEDFRSSGIPSGTGSTAGALHNLLGEKGYLLRRGEIRWPAHKILLQVAVEDADDSAITQAASAWLDRGHCDWLWLRNRTRPERQTRSPVLAVMQGHRGKVNGAQALPDGRLLSWSDDKTLRLWDGTSGAELAVLEGHRKWVNGAQALPDGRLLSWARDISLRLWDGVSGVMLTALHGHSRQVKGVQVLPDGRLLSWSDDKTLRLWDSASGAMLEVLEGHAGYVNGAEVLPDGRVLSWSMDNTLRLWDGASGAMLAVLEGHASGVNGAQVLPDGRLLSWSNDETPRLWDGANGTTLAVLNGHTGTVNGAQVLPDGRLLSWSMDGTLRVWDGANGTTLAVLKGHTGSVNGAQVLPDGRLLSWSMDGTLRVWDGANGTTLAVLNGHTGTINGAQVLPDGRLLSWSRDNTLRLWDGASGVMLGVMQGHTDFVRGVQILPDGRLLSWSADRTLRLWDTTSGAMLAIPEGHTSAVSGAQILPDGRLLSWSMDNTLRLWDRASGAMLAVLEGHWSSVNGRLVRPDGRLSSWGRNKALRLLDSASKAPRDVYPATLGWRASRSPASGNRSAPLPTRGAWVTSGSVFGSHTDSVYMVNRREGWTARWHGQDLKTLCATAETLIVGSGHHLFFLDLMRGGHSLNRNA
jgi:WD40 repeat protein